MRPIVLVVLQSLLTGAAVVMSAWADMPVPATLGLAVVGAAATLAAAPLASPWRQMRRLAVLIAWIGTGAFLASVLLDEGIQATVGSYFDTYFIALVWIMVGAVWPSSRGLPVGRLRGAWRLLVTLWLMLGGLMWVGAGYLGNRSAAFFGGLLVLLAVLILCHLWFRLRAVAIVMVNTLILGIVGLPLLDLAVRGIALLTAPPEPSRQYYLYDVARKDPPAFGRWWNYYLRQWRQAEKRLYMPDPDPILSFRLRPNSHARVARSSISINRRGFRGPEVPAAKGNAYRIVALGESTTFGVTLNPDDRPWPELLEELIRERLKPRRPVQVINAGVPGYRIDQNLSRLRRDILPLKPDLIISYHGINAFGMLRDAVPFTVGARAPVYKARPLQLLADAEYRLRLIGFQHRQQPRHIAHPKPLADPLSTRYARLYRQLISFTRTNGIRLALANYSMAVNDHSPRPVVEFYQLGYPAAPWQIRANLVHSQVVQRLAAQHPEVCFVDTHPHLDGEHDKFIDLVHFDAAGDQQLAENMFNALRPILEQDLLRL